MTKIFEFPSKKESVETKSENSASVFEVKGENIDAEEHSKKLKEIMSKYAVETILTPEQDEKLKRLKDLIHSLKMNISQNAYRIYYEELNKSNAAELAPILDNLSEKDFQSRPAYTCALIDILDKKNVPK